MLQPLERAREAFDAMQARLVVSEATWQNFVARRMYLSTSRAELPFTFGQWAHIAVPFSAASWKIQR